jgi:hypothetical protein
MISTHMLHSKLIRIKVADILGRDIGQEELVSCSSDYSTRWLAIKETFNNV